MLRGYEEASKCKMCSKAFVKMSKRVGEYEDFEEFYGDFIREIKDENPHRVMSYTLAVLFTCYKSEKLDDNLGLFDGLSYSDKKSVEDLILFFHKKKIKKDKKL